MKTVLLVGVLCVLMVAGCQTQPNASAEETTTGLEGWGVSLASAASTASSSGRAVSGGSSGNADQFLIVDCLLPGKVRKLGRSMTYLTARQAIKTTAMDCEIRGGEYVAYDRGSYASALNIWLPQANSGDKVAQTYVGEMYEKGLGVQPDYGLAARWYEKAADQGYPRAQINLGYLYERGMGVPKDTVKALNLYRQASGLDIPLSLGETPMGSSERKELEGLRTEVEQRKAESASLKRQLAETRRELEKARGQYQKRQNRLEQEERKLDKSRQELDRLRSQAVGGGSADLTRLEEQLRNRESQVAKQNKEIAQLREKVSRLETGSGQSPQELAKARKELEQRRAAVDAEKRKVDQEREEIENQRRQLVQQKAATPELGRREKDVARREAELDRQRAEIAQLKDELDKATSGAKQSSQQLEKARLELEQRKAALEADRRKVEQERQEVEQQKQQVAQINIPGLQKKEEEFRRKEAQLAKEREEMSNLKDEIARLESEASGTSVDETADTKRAAPSGSPSIEIIDPQVIATRGIRIAPVNTGVTQREIVGRVNASAGVMAFSVNDHAESVGSDGMFRVNIPITDPAKTPVKIVAVDKKGRRADAEFVLMQGEIRPGSDTTPGGGVLGEQQKKPLPRINFGNYYALVIGNNNYARLPKLDTASNDARTVSQVLSTKYGFKVTTLIDATRYDILAALNRLREQLTERDNLLIYYAGHGDLDKVNARGYWLPVDAEQDSNANWISNIQITDVLNAMSAKQVMIIADSCYSGILTRSALTNLEAGMSPEARYDWLSVMAQKRARVVLTSGGLQPVMDSGGGGQHSIFAKSLVAILQANNDVLEGQRLGRQVSARVASASKNLPVEQVPEYAPIRYAGHEAGDFFFVPAGS